MIKILGIDDSVTTCECCGKSGLKSTVVVEIGGEVKHYGSICATHHTGMTSKAIKKGIELDYQNRLDAAMREFKTTPEYLAQQVAFSNARKAGLVGKPFRDATHDATTAANAKSVAIAAKHNVKLLSA